MTFVLPGGVGQLRPTALPGASWTSLTAAVTTAGTWNAVAYGNGTFITGGGTASTGTPGLMITSPDGTTWTSRTNPFGQGPVSGLTFAQGIFVAAGSGAIYTSTNGISWTSRTVPAVSWYSAAYGNNTFVIVGNNAAATSPDGTTWTSRTIPTGAWWNVVFGNGMFVAGTNAANGPIASSPDGITWTNRITITPACYVLAFGNNTFIAAGYNNSTIYTSTDGMSWTTRASTIPSDAFYAGGFAFGKFYLLGGLTSTVSRSSVDGINWAATTMPGNTWRGIVDNGTAIVVVGNGIATSP